MVAHYEMMTLKVSDLDRVKIPTFQRGFVWTAKKKNEFIETLHEGLPFGTLLVYPESQDTESKLILIDGQQRLSTIRSYQNDPLLYWKPLNKEYFEDKRNRASSLLGEELSVADFSDLIRMEKAEQLEWGVAHSGNGSSCNVLEALKVVDEVQQRIKEYVDLDGLSILAIKYTGERDRIAEVFANLNRGGIPLKKYEIWNAAWIDTQIALLDGGISPLQDEMLDNVKTYYSRMAQNAEFDLDGYSEDELTRSRTISLSEFGSALGLFMMKRLEALIPQSETSAQEYGFGVLGIAVDVDNRKLDTLNAKIDQIRNSVEDILKRVDRICINLNDIFEKYLKRYYAQKSNGYELGLSSTFKVLSYFAALWNLDPDSNEYKQSLRNIRSYYIYDSLISAWSSHGDQRLLEYYPNKSRNYMQPIGKEQFKKAFDQWLDDSTPGVNFNSETKALMTIHANLTYLSKDVSFGESLELEHIIAKKRIQAAEDGNKKHLLVGNLGNCMYLPRSTNNSKKDKTLYEVNEDHRFDALIKSSAYFSETEMEEIARALDDHEYETVNSFILQRAKAVGYTISDLLLDGQA